MSFLWNLLETVTPADFNWYFNSNDGNVSIDLCSTRTQVYNVVHHTKRTFYHRPMKILREALAILLSVGYRFVSNTLSKRSEF